MNLNSAIIVSAIALGVTWVLTPWARSISEHFGMVDQPNYRKLHTKPVPYGGGIAIFLGFLAAFLVVNNYSTAALGFIVAAFILVILGIIDDLKGLHALPKLVFQSIAAVIAINAGIVINTDVILRGHLPGIEFLAIPITFLWIVGITNAINLIDGLDGLAAGVSSISAATIAIVAITNGQYLVAIYALALAAAAAGFLPHNFLSQVFMGDTGSMFLGFSLATLSIMGSVKLAAAFSLFVPVMILAIPIFDTIFAIIRRIITREPIYVGDRKHLHHRLLDLGFSKIQTVCVIYALSTVFGGLAIVSALVRARVAYLIFGSSIVAVVLFSLILVYFHQLKLKENGWSQKA